MNDCVLIIFSQGKNKKIMNLWPLMFGIDLSLGNGPRLFGDFFGLYSAGA
jgi:hypothetical protein